MESVFIFCFDSKIERGDLAIDLTRLEDRLQAFLDLQKERDQAEQNVQPKTL